MSDKYLIINADDFGMCQAHNIATEELFKCGGITSATIMTPCPAATEAAEFAKANPELSIGVHLTTTAEWKSYKWGPVSQNHTSLTDENGYFFPTSLDFATHARADEVERELVAQVEWLLQRGVTPSHMDNHMGSLYGVANGDFSLLYITAKIAERYSLPFRFPTNISAETFTNGTLNVKADAAAITAAFSPAVDLLRECRIATPDYLVPGDWLGEQDKSYENYKEYMLASFDKIEPGISETYIHPAVECDEIKGISAAWRRRVWEHRLFSDPRTREYISSLGIKLINYRELKAMREDEYGF